MLYRALCIVLLLSVAGIAAPPTSRPAKAEKSALKARIDDINFADMTAQQAVEAIAAKSSVPVSVNWKLLEASGIAATTKVRGHLMDVTVKEALQHVLSELDTAAPLEVDIANDKVTISTAADTKLTETRVYNVGPQLERIASELSAQLSKNTSPNELRQAALDRLASMITQHIAPNSWRDAGGTVGAISFSGTRMTVTNRRSALHDLEQYLKDLDKPRGR
jgi:hypothetical protein